MPDVPAIQPDSQPVALNVSGTCWWFSVASVRRVGRDLFVHVDLQGPDVCAVTIHLCGGIVLGITARDMLTAACKWLLVRGDERHAFIDLTGQQPRWLASGVA
jgi:hypothetical protein